MVQQELGRHRYDGSYCGTSWGEKVRGVGVGTPADVGTGSPTSCQPLLR